MISALLDKPVAFDTAVLGEVGLSSEVRSVSQVMMRINEAEKLGFKKCILPKNNLKNHQEDMKSTIKIIGVENLKEALEHLS